MAGCSDCANLHALSRLFNTAGTLEFRSIRAPRQDLYFRGGRERLSSIKFRKTQLTQRRKGAKKGKPTVSLCAFAPLRELSP
jgi:hypothetical protein